MKSNKTGAIFKPWASIRFIRFFLKEEALENDVRVGRNQQKARQTGRTSGPFNAKAGALRRGRKRHFQEIGDRVRKLPRLAVDRTQRLECVAASTVDGRAFAAPEGLSIPQG
jgi:hypothetical protein